MQYMENEVRTFYNWLKQFRVEGRDSSALYDVCYRNPGNVCRKSMFRLIRAV